MLVHSTPSRRDCRKRSEIGYGIKKNERMLGRRKKSIIPCLLGREGKEEGVLRKKSTGKTELELRQNWLKQARGDSGEQPGLYRCHAAICIQPLCSREAKAQLRVPAFPAPGRGERSAAAGQMALPSPLLLGGAADGSWKPLCAAPASLSSSPGAATSLPSPSPATYTGAHVHPGTVKIPAGPVKKIGAFISRVSSMFEKYFSFLVIYAGVFSLWRGC